MKFFALPVFVFLCSGAGACRAGNILIQNFFEDGSSVLPVVQHDGRLPPTGSGIAVVGGFIDESMVSGTDVTLAGWRMLLTGFVPFGSSTARLGDSNAYGIPGLYSVDVSQQLSADHALVGRSMFTLIGNESTLAASTSVVVIRHAESFPADQPVFGAMLFPFAEGVEILFGEISGAVPLPLLGEVPQSLRLETLSGTVDDFSRVPHPQVPEAGVGLLALLGAGWTLRRRKRAWAD